MNDMDKKEILGDNKILYRMHKRPMTETCMCWGLEVPDAWLNEIGSLSKKLEAINILIYPKHRVRIQADQVKDKFGTLRFYYTVVADPPAWVCLYEELMEKFFLMLAKVDYKLKRVVDKEAYDEVIDVKIASEDVDAEVEKCKNASNVEVIDDPSGNGKIRRTTMHRPESAHYEPTQHVFLHKLLKLRHHATGIIRKILRWKPSCKQECISEFMDSYASEMIEKSTGKLECTCEKCGATIGTKYSPRCVTRGWISYLCERCADANDTLYSKNGEIWKAGKCIKPKEDEACDDD